MDFFKLLIRLDQFLSALLGISSPWIVNKRLANFCKIFSNFLFMILSLWCYFTTPLFVIQFRFIAHTVRSCLLVAIVFGISVTFYKYNFDRSRFSRFIEEFFKKEEYHVTSTEDFRSCFKNYC